MRLRPRESQHIGILSALHAGQQHREVLPQHRIALGFLDDKRKVGLGAVNEALGSGRPVR